jgi:thioredoxin reductase (NADPH)
MHNFDNNINDNYKNSEKNSLVINNKEKIQNTSNFFVNTIIIGGGSAGLYLATLLEKQNISYKIIESFHMVGGQCITAYPHKNVYDIPGTGPITGQEYVLKLLDNIHKDSIITNSTYISHEKTSFGWSVKINNLNGNCEFYSLNLVFATGIGMGGYEKPKIANLELYENKQIFFFPKENINHYINKNIVVFGGGDSAFDALEILSQITWNLSLVHRRPNFNAMKNKQKILEKINVYNPYNLVSLNENEDDRTILKSVTIERNKETKVLNADYIFFCYGYNTKGNLKFSVHMNNMKHESGVFAIGAASTYALKRDLITTGLWEARITFSNLIL